MSRNFAGQGQSVTLTATSTIDVQQSNRQLEIVDRTAGSLELMRQDGIAGLKAWWLLLTYLWVRPGMFRKIAGAWFKFFLPGFHPWNEDDRHLLTAYERIASGTEAKRKVRCAV